MRQARVREGDTALNSWGKVVGRLRQWDEKLLVRAEAEDSIVAYLVRLTETRIPDRSSRLGSLGPISAALVA